MSNSEGDENTAIVIEPMCVEDLDQVMEIEQQSFSWPWSKSVFLSDMEELGVCYYVVARLGHRIVGYAGMRVNGDEAHVTTIAVAPIWRGRNVGKRLLHCLLAEGLRRGASRAFLEVRKGNIVAQNLYCKYGFEKTGLRKNYYEKPREDALLMTLNDIAKSVGMMERDLR